MHRLQISLPPSLVGWLEDRARNEDISLAEVIRRLVAQAIAAQPEPGEPPGEPAVREPFAAYAFRGTDARKGQSMDQSTVNVHEAKTHLSRLLSRVQRGETIVIANAGRPVAKLTPVQERPGKRRAGSAEGHFVVPDDFDDPLPDEILRDFGV
jgi:prevent-host-death family protein